MSYLVDGNNLTGQSERWRKSGTGARRVLLDDLAAFASQRGVRIVVVFDGAPERFFADGASYKGVGVRYAQRGSNADERIKEIVEASRERRTLFVVTSDRQLANYVRACGAKTVNAKEFQQRMTEETRKHNLRSAPAEKEERVEAQEMNEWMRYFGVAPEDD